MARLRVTKPNAGNRAWYRRKLEALVARMIKSTLWWVSAAYKKNDAKLLSRVIKELSDYWEKQFNESSVKIADDFLRRVDAATSNSMQRAMRDIGFRIKWKNTKEVRNVLNSIRETQISLIKSIPQEHLDKVSGVVQRGIQNGRDVNYITERLRSEFEVTKERARLIANDQNNKATEAIKRARDESIGIKEGIWIHIPGKKTSRKTHIAMNGKRFKLNEGLYDGDVGRNVMCGELVSCYCTYKPVLPNFLTK